jgi:hypothetical protein
MGERDGIEYLLWRHELDDGEVTTLYAVRHPLPSTRARVVHVPRTERLDVWCQVNEIDEAIIGGFFVRDPYRPLGDLWIRSEPVPHEEIVPPYASRRACVGVENGDIRVAPREDFADRPSGDLVHAGPLLVSSPGGRLRSNRGPRGILRRGGAVRLGHHRRPPSARGARNLGRLPDHRRVRRAALPRRRRAVDARARRGDGRARGPRARSTSTAAAP